MYENQKVFLIIPVNKQIIKVWINRVKPIVKGCLVFKKIKVVKIEINIIMIK